MIEGIPSTIPAWFVLAVLIVLLFSAFANALLMAWCYHRGQMRASPLPNLRDIFPPAPPAPEKRPEPRKLPRIS